MVTDLSLLSVKMLHSAWAFETEKAIQASTLKQLNTAILKGDIVFFIRRHFSESELVLSIRKAAEGL